MSTADSPAAALSAKRRPAILQAEVLWPVLVVCGLWLGMSLGTNAYLAWVETEYEWLFAENLRSLKRAAELDAEVWGVYAGIRSPVTDGAALSSRVQGLRTRLQALPSDSGGASSGLRSDLPLRSATLDFVNLIESVRGAGAGAADAFFPAGSSSEQRLLGLATGVSESASRLRMAHAEWIDGRRQMLADLHFRVVLLRSLILLLGLPIGILLGWRVARRLQSTATRIAVTLNETAIADDSSGMTVQITRDSSFEDVHRQAERVVERVRSVVCELQAARREVIQSERLAAVGELAAGVAHELRNPLTSVKLLLQHAARQPAEYRISEQKLQLILEEIRRMESTIQGLLDFARRPALKRHHHDLRETLQRSLNLVEGRMQQSQVELQWASVPGALWVMGDSELLSQVFVNLFLNAIEAMPGGGQLSVSTLVLRNFQGVRLTVMDTGSGFPAEVLTRLFEPFSTTKERGTGLGLAICRRIVLEHGGQIQAGNRPEGGAVVSVELPLEAASTECVTLPAATESDLWPATDRSNAAAAPAL